MIEQGAYMLIACGAFIFVLSFLGERNLAGYSNLLFLAGDSNLKFSFSGYCGAIKESRVLLTAYGLFIIIIVLLQVQ